MLLVTEYESTPPAVDTVTTPVGFVATAGSVEGAIADPEVVNVRAPEGKLASTVFPLAEEALIS